MLFPNVNCVITKRLGFDANGREQMGQSFDAKCAIVKLIAEREKTTVRADSSASRGAAHEITADARLLFKPTTDVAVGDKVEVAGIALRVISVFPRFDMPGRHDHNQVDLEIWA